MLNALFCCQNMITKTVTNSGLEINFDYPVFLIKRRIKINDNNCNVSNMKLHRRIFYMALGSIYFLFICILKTTFSNKQYNKIITK